MHVYASSTLTLIFTIQFIQLTVNAYESVANKITMTGTFVTARRVDAVRMLTTEVFVQRTFIDIWSLR